MVGEEGAARHPRREAKLARKVADAGPEVGAACPRFLPEHPHFAGGGPHEVEQDAHRGGLAGPVRADHAVHGAGRHVEVDAAQGGVRSVALLEAADAEGRVGHSCSFWASIAARAASSMVLSL
ncbi:hypothetical protein GCM10025869_36140 [Homoserinibacter gongjuensis]|uniref:Uncharacterized protein n=1 Tax=Homoserinibacter gongjuensis TaxID=1162968 RepID=A0ABQ6K1Y7_9MICO|nr:hypothetical protein GCM10025869_36140 [Homoserinibacter gongjuensis]